MVNSPDGDSGIRILPQEYVEKHRRCDARFHNYIVLITESNAFNAAIIVTVIVNALTLALETDEALKMDYGEVFEGFDSLYLAIYTIEFLTKIYAEPVGYWTSAYNWFDFFVLIISFTQAQMIWSTNSSFDALRVLRAMRTLRLLRTISFIKGLQASLMIYCRNPVYAPNDEGSVADLEFGGGEGWAKVMCACKVDF